MRGFRLSQSKINHKGADCCFLLQSAFSIFPLQVNSRVRIVKTMGGGSDL